MKRGNTLILVFVCLWMTVAVRAQVSDEITVIPTTSNTTLFEAWGSFVPEEISDERDGGAVTACHLVVSEGQPWAGVSVNWASVSETLTGVSFAYVHVITKCPKSGQNVKGRFGYGDREYENSFILADEWQDILFKVAADGQPKTITELIIMLDYSGPFPKSITVEKIIFNNDPALLIADPSDTEKPVLTEVSLVDGSVGYSSLKMNVSATDNIGIRAYLVTDEANNFSKEFIAVDNVITVDDLSPNTTYTFSVYAKDAAGNLSEPLSLGNITTEMRASEDKGELYHFDGVSGGPISYSIINNGNKKVTYTLVPNDGAILNFAEIRLYRNGGFTGFQGMTIAEDGKSATYEIKDINDNEVIYNMFVWGFTLPNPDVHYQNAENDKLEKYIFYIASEGLTLVDSNIYSATKETKVASALYTRSFQNAGAYSICLPFKAEIPAGITVKEYTGGADGTVRFTKVEGTEMVAHMPYILEVGAAGEYEFRGITEDDGKVIVKAASGVQTIQGTSAQYRFVGNYEAKTDVNDVYFLNSDGSDFVKTASASIGSFRAYIEVLPGVTKAPKLIIGEDEGGATILDTIDAGELVFYSGNGVLKIMSPKDQVITVFGIDGIIRTLELHEGDNTLPDLAKGIYVIANQKVVIY